MDIIVYIFYIQISENMSIELPREETPELKETEWVKKQVREELKRFNKETFYEKNGDEIKYNMDTVKQYLWVLKNKKTWKELISKNSSAMVMAVQIALYSQDYSFGDIDGMLWEKTKQAIRKFQADHNLPVDSYWRSVPTTIQKLLEVISGEKRIDIPEPEIQEAQEIMEWNDSNISAQTENIWDRVKNEVVTEVNNGVENPVTENAVEVESDTISPEVQSIVNSPARNYDLSGNLTSLNYAEAVAMAESWLNYINLPNITQISGKVFEALLKFGGWINIWLRNLSPEFAEMMMEYNKAITFSKLENIDNDVYKILWKTKCSLNFTALKHIDVQAVWELVKKPWGDILLDWIEDISPEIAEKINQYHWIISLNWVKHLSKESAEILSHKIVWTVFLRWLETPVEPEVLEWLIAMPANHLNTNHEILLEIYNYRKEKERAWKDLSQIVIDVVDRNTTPDTLAQLTKLSKDEAQLLAKSSLLYLNLSWVNQIDPDTFEALIQYKRWMNLWLEILTPELAKKLENNQSFITFSKIENMSMDVYQLLWKTRWTLNFKSIKSITAEEIWELIKKPWWDIYLNWIESIDPAVAEKIVEYPRTIMLDWVKRLSKESAEILSHKTMWRIFLNWLETPISNDVLEQLMNIPSQYLTTNSAASAEIYKYRRQKEEILSENN